MTAGIDRRLRALEVSHSDAFAAKLFLVRLVTPGRLDEYPAGICAVPPYLPAIDREPLKGWDEFH